MNTPEHRLPEPPSVLHTTPEQAAKGRNTILMEFPTRVFLSVESGPIIAFPEGIHPVARELADHWYLKANGVEPYVAGAI